MGAIIGAIVAFVQTYVTAVVVAIVGSTLTPLVTAQVVNLLTIAVLAVLAGAVLQVVGKLLGIGKITDQIAKVLYAIAIIIVIIAAIIAQSLMLALVFLGGAIVFLLLVDSIFGTEASKTFTDAGMKIVEAVVDVVGDVIGGAVDIIGTGLSSLFGGKLGTYLLLGLGGYFAYKMLSKKKDDKEVRLNVSTEELRGNASGGYGRELAGAGRAD